MAKFQIVILFVALVVAIAQAEPQRLRASSARLAARPRTRVLARQEAADEAPVTPYPSADELKPEVPFDEAADVPAEEPQPEEVPVFTLYNIPDEVYGPPENELAVEEPASEQFPAPVDEQQARVVAALRVAKLRQRQAAYLKAAAYRAAALKRSAKLKAAAATKA